MSDVAIGSLGLAELAGVAAGCTLCPLSDGRTNVVFGTGDPNADLMFVGEGPGAEEDKQGLPFVGRSGKLLDELLVQEIGLERSGADGPRQLRHQGAAGHHRRHHPGARAPLRLGGRRGVGAHLPPGRPPARRRRAGRRVSSRRREGQALPRSCASWPGRWGSPLRSPAPPSPSRTPTRPLSGPPPLLLQIGYFVVPAKAGTQCPAALLTMLARRLIRTCVLGLPPPLPPREPLF